MLRAALAGAVLVLAQGAIQAQIPTENICAVPLRSALMTVKVNTAGGASAS